MSDNSELKNNIITAEQMNKFVTIEGGDTLTGPLYGVTPGEDAVKEFATAEYVKNQVNELIESGFCGVPVGTILHLATTTSPEGYLLCDGRAVSRTVYKSLFDIINIIYGEGDGSTTFNLPNLIGKFIEGYTTPGIYKESAIINKTATSSSDPTDGTRLNFIVSDQTSSGEPSDTLTTVQPESLTLLPYIKAYGNIIGEGDLDLTSIDARINTVESSISTLEGKVTANKSSISTLEGKVTTNESSISELENNQNNYILKFGDRGVIAGYESVNQLSGSQTITINSSDTTYITTSGSTTITFTPGDSLKTSTKVIYLTASSATTLTISGGSWANGGNAPTWGNSGKHLILVASFIGGQVIVSVFDNDDI